tara:strand:- start:4277 stop:4522 length:246 start_codon:yes stop_codon:yes gene_type:complete
LHVTFSVTASSIDIRFHPKTGIFNEYKINPKTPTKELKNMVKISRGKWEYRLKFVRTVYTPRPIHENNTLATNDRIISPYL